MFEVSARMQEFINKDCDMDDDLARNIVKEFGSEIEFIKKYDGYAKRGINADTPHFGNRLAMMKLYEENKTNILIWAKAHAQSEGFDGISSWLKTSKNNNYNQSAESIDIVLEGHNSYDAHYIVTLLMMELTCQLCRQYKEFITDYEDA